MDREGIGLIAVSYDAIATLRTFADAHGIGYPLLADEGSRVITELGLLDRDLEAHHGAFGMPTADHQRGVAYPAMFLVGQDGRVQQKRIQPNYRAREGGPLLLEEALRLGTPPAGPACEAAQPRVRARLRADSPGYVRWQKTRLHVELAAEEGWHVYADPVPPGYTGLTVRVQSEADVEVGEPAYPGAHDFSIAGLDEKFRVYEGAVSVVVPVAFNVGKDHGPVTVSVRVSFQACDATTCLAPATTDLEITLSETAVP